jgi:CheY-like chemotaxis protein
MTMDMGARQVLVVEDDQPIRELETVILEQAGYLVEAVADGALALAALGRRSPDLVLLDLVMPSLDGWGVLEQIGKATDPPPVVLVSGANEMVPPPHLGTYVSGYVFKPFDVEQLLKTCEVALTTPGHIPPHGSRRDTRRTLLLEAMLISRTGMHLATAQLLQVSRRGFRAEVGVPIPIGDPVQIEVRLPGQAERLRLCGHVRWRSGQTVGAEIEGLSVDEEQLLRLFAGPIS